jgi:glycosyltransferase involved in cell wall biosynthesis
MIYFCLPAYNEAATVGLSLYKIGEVMKQVNREYELIVLNDGSTDETLHVIKSYERILPLRVIDFESNRGFGPSLMTLIKEVVQLSILPERDIVVTIEADFSQNPSVVPSMVREIEGGADVVIASSFVKGSSMLHTPILFKILNSMLYILMRNLYGITGVRDYVSSFRTYRVSILKRGLDYYKEKMITLQGRTSNTELLLNLNYMNPKIVEVPLHFRYDVRKRESRIRVHQIWWEYIRMITRLWLDRR